jgi:hypothetical protein
VRSNGISIFKNILLADCDNSQPLISYTKEEYVCV